MTETGVVTILFTDLVGSTQLAAEIGDRAADDVRRAHFAVLRSVLADAQGEEVKTLGDGLMAAFTSSVRAIECAVQMQRVVEREGRRPGQPSLGLRVGLSAGEASREDGDWFGRPVVEAARLCADAAGGEILAADVVRVLAGSRVSDRFGPVQPRQLKGLPDAVPVCALAWEAGTVSLPPSPALVPMAETVFVGRETELGELQQAWDRARSGDLTTVLLGGEPGVGKTRLAAQVAMAAHATGATALLGRCDEDSVVPYQPFVEALRHYVSVCSDDQLKEQVGRDAAELVRLVPELGERVPGLAPDFLEEPDRFRLFAAVASLLRGAAAERPIVLVLDDLHWADKPTLVLLQFVLRQPTPFPVLIVGTYRDTDLARTHPLATMLAELRRESGVRRIAVRGLAGADIERFLEAVTGHELGRRGRDLAHVLAEETEGNPFFIGEILRNLVETGGVFQRDGVWTFDVPASELGIPEGVREAIGRRLSQLSEDANRVLREAAVLGREFEFAVLDQMSGLDTDALLGALEEALDRQLVEEVVDAARATYAFTHALVRQTLYEELSLARKQRLHVRAADALESRPPPAGTVGWAAAIASHLRSGGVAADREKAVTYSRRAATEASGLFAWEDAVDHLEAALEILDEDDVAGETRARVLVRLGDVLVTTGLDHERGIVLLDQALEIFSNEGLEEQAAVVQSRLGSHLSTLPATMDITRALALFEAAEPVIARGSDRRAHGYLAAGRAAASLWALRPEEGLDASTRAMELGEEVGDPGLWGLAAAIHGWGLMCVGRLRESTEVLERAWAAGDAAGRAGPLFVAAWVGGALDASLYDCSGARVWVERALDHPAIRQAPARRSILLETGTAWLVNAGDIAGGLRLYEQIGEARYGVANLMVETLLGDRPAALDDWLALAADARARGDRWDEYFSLFHCTPMLAESGDIEQAKTDVRAGIEAAARAPFVGAEIPWRAMLAALCSTPSDAEVAREQAKAARSAMTAGENWRGLAAEVSRAEAAAAAAQGRWDAADEAYRQSTSLLSEWTAPFVQASFLHEWGQMLMRASDRDGARQHLSESFDLYSSLGAAEALKAYVAADLAALG